MIYPTVEVGFSEGYDQGMDLWLIGRAGKVGVIGMINLTETPAYCGKPFSYPR